MIIVLFGLVSGILLGYYLPVELSTISSLYMSVGLLAAIDTVVGGIRASMEHKFNMAVFISGFFVNAFLAIVLSYLGDKMGVPLYYAAIFVFGTRLFDNTGIIRRIVLERAKRILMKKKGSRTVSGEGLPVVVAKTGDERHKMEN